MKNLLILSEIEKGSPLTQAILADIAGVSLAMVNQYIKNLCSCEYIRMQGNNKNTTYEITEKGIERKRYLVVSLMSELTELYAWISNQVRQILLPVVRNGEKSVLLYGAGETGKVCARLASEIPAMKILGFIDDNPSLQGNTLQGHPIYSLETALTIPFDQIIITTFIDNSRIRDKLLCRIEETKIIQFAEYHTITWQREEMEL